MSETVLRRLGGLDTRVFLARYWGRQPLVVRSALEDFAPPVDRARLFELAARDDVESRLVSSFEGNWRLRHGPIPRRGLPARERPGWTLLVQGLDLHERPAADLASRFRFVPAARFDDLMASWASPGGGVGPHVDQYDVFLLQAQGRRRWRIARRFDPALREGAPLRLLRAFRHEEEFVLGPGDLLYLPPGVAHEGVALEECITLSVGFRVLPWQEVAQSWLDLQPAQAPLAGGARDRAIEPARHPARLPEAMARQAHAALKGLRPTLAQARRTLLCALTEPKAQVVFDPPRPALARNAFERAALGAGVRTDLRTRLLHAPRDFAVNGELLKGFARLEGGAREALRRLADERELPAQLLRALPVAQRRSLLDILHLWHRSGWLAPVLH